MANDDSSASELIDDRIRDVGGWRGETLSRVRGLIKDAALYIRKQRFQIRLRLTVAFLSRRIRIDRTVHVVG